MNRLKNPNSPSSVIRSIDKTLGSFHGNIMVYLVVVLLIFGVLGVTIASLFSASTTSSATPNDARRAYYVAESGVRYALSRIRNANFHQGFIEEINNTPQYTLENGSSFTINVFSPWFVSSSVQDTSINNVFSFSVPNEGKIPQNFSIPSTGVLLVNWNRFNGSAPSNPPPSDSYAQIAGSSTTAGNKSLTITMEGSDDLVVNTDETVCLAIQPTDADGSSPLQAGEDIYVAAEAKIFFPPRNGTIRIVTADTNQAGEYVYEELVDETTRMKLTNLAPLPGTSFASIDNFSTNDWVVLSRYNYRVITTGTSGDVTTEIGQNKQVWFFPHMGDWTIAQREFIEAVSQNVSDIGSPVAKVEQGVTEAEDKVILGGSSPGFGNLWYGGDKPIGGDTNFCIDGRCFFQDGIRVFFTLDNSGEGEGFIFSLIAGDDGSGNPFNTRDSAGGDYQGSELLGYAGDSRYNNTPQFLDGSGEGLKPPKMGLEFDTRTQYDQVFNLQRDYCDSANLKTSTRNDPRPNDSNQDAAQFVFWGSEDPPHSLELTSCRADSPNKASYDDNRHDAEDFHVKWTFATSGEVKSSPAVGADGTIYVGSDDHNVYALNPEDRKRHFDFGDRPFPTASEWSFGTGAYVRSSPLVVEDGSGTTIYIGADDHIFYALDRDGNPLWNFDVGGDVSLGRPSIGPNGNIYVSNRRNTSPYIYSLNPDEREAGNGFPQFLDQEWTANIGDENEYMAGVDPDSGVIYTDRSGNQLLALNPTGSQRWVLDVNSDVGSTPRVGSDGTVYFTTHWNSTATFPTGEIMAATSAGTLKWRYPGNTQTIGTVDTSPALSNDESTVYAVASNGRLYARNTTDGSAKWNYSPIGIFEAADEIQSSPTVDPEDDTIYVGSDEDPGGKILAINPDGTLRWIVDDPPLDVNSTPAVDPISKTVYVGADDNKLYAVNQIAEPRSYRHELYETNKVVSADDFATISFSDSDNWLQEGPWAVRLEVTRDLVAGEGVYVLKAWVEKCADAGCSKPLTSLFRDTLVNYDVAGVPPKLVQTIKLSEAEHDKFERFLFGFTTAVATGDTQESIIKFFELSFIRPTDPVVTSDPNLTN